MLYATIGKSKIQVQSWEQVSKAYRSTIEKLGIGASQTPPCYVIDQSGSVVAHVSYNGKVWHGPSWTSGSEPIYTP